MMMKLYSIALIFGLISMVSCRICDGEDDGPCFDLKPYSYSLDKHGEFKKDVTFHCYVHNKGSNSIIWLHDNDLISVNGQIIKNDNNFKIDMDDTMGKYNLKISNIDQSYKGSYTCQISMKEARNLDYVLDVLIPPTVIRKPAGDLFELTEGDSLEIQCEARGNPEPTLTWKRKSGAKIENLNDEFNAKKSNSTLTLQNLSELHADTYSCVGENGVGDEEASSEFLLLVKFKPRVSIIDEENIVKGVMYSSVGRQEQIRCIATAYPKPELSLSFNNQKIPIESIDSMTHEEKRSILTYNFIGGDNTFGTYTCHAQNQMGSSQIDMTVDPRPLDISINTDKLPIYSDAIIFEWSVVSGSSIEKLNVQVTDLNTLNVTDLVTSTKVVLSNGTEKPATYHEKNMVYNDFYDVSNLKSNTTYSVRIRVQNQFNVNDVWSDWSRNISVTTHTDRKRVLIRHKSRHHDRYHRLFGDEVDGGIYGNSAPPSPATYNINLLIVFILNLFNYLLR